jgi:hypothetical protein
MDLEILNKKLSTYRNARNQVRNVPDELLLEVLSAWEHWTGSTPDFYRGLGISHRGMGSMMGKAKRLRREGRVPTSEFKEITEALLGGSPVTTGFTGAGIELSWEQGKIIRFPQVEQLIDFLKKVA